VKFLKFLRAAESDAEFRNEIFGFVAESRISSSRGSSRNTEHGTAARCQGHMLTDEEDEVSREADATNEPHIAVRCSPPWNGRRNCYSTIVMPQNKWSCHVFIQVS
jgi:hypothetical protein